MVLEGAQTALYRWQYVGRKFVVGSYWRLRGLQGAAVPQRPERILIVLSGLLGDSVMSTPVIMEARRLWSDARLVLLGRRHNCELLAACPAIDERILAGAVPFSLRGRSLVGKLKEDLRKKDFDIAIVLLGGEFAPVLAEIGVPVRVGGGGDFLSSCYTHRYDFRSPREWGPEEQLNALRALGMEVQSVAPRLWVEESARRSARERLRELGLPDGARYAVVHPFGSTPYQWWRFESLAELAEALAEEGLRTVLVGGPEVRHRVTQPVPETIIDTMGRLSIQELLAVIEGAALVVTTDSGPFHMAGALGRPIVGLFRSRRPEHATRYPNATVVFGCDRRCERECRWDRCRHLPCREMQALSVAEVCGAVRERLHAEAALEGRCDSGR